MGWEEVVHTRDELYKSVWAEPMTHIARRIGLSDVAVAKICRRMQIPLPGRGYWARRAAGWPARLRPLPPPKPGTPVSHSIRRYVASPDEISAAAETRELIEKHSGTEPPLPVPEVLSEPHALIARSRAMLERLAGKQVRATESHRCIDIFATGPALDRALRIMDVILKTVEERGYAIEVTSPTVPEERRGERSPSRTFVLIGDSKVQISLEETVRKVALPLPEPRKPTRPFEYIPRPKRQYEYHPTGRLNLGIDNVSLPGSPNRWSDRQADPIENRLTEFIASVEVAAERLRLERMEAEKRRLAAISEERRRKAIEAQNAAHDVLAKDLQGRLQKWRLAREIEVFAEAVQKAAADRSETGEEIQRWRQWTLAYVKHLDRQALAVLKLHSEPEGYSLRSLFDWSHKFTASDALQVFFAPVEDLARQIAEKEAKLRS